MSKKRVSLFRNVLQFSVLSLILLFFIANQFGLSVVNFESYCPMGGIQALLTLMQDGLIACNMTVTQMVLGVIFLICILVFGKLFCSHLCPLGTVSEWLGRITDRYRVRKDINGVPEKVLRSLKYILLFITITGTLKTGELLCKQYDPFYSSITLYGHKVNYLFATISILIFIIGSLIYRLFWCKYLCPLGAISNIFKYWLGVGVVIAVLGAMYYFELGVDISIAVGIICIVGYTLEIFKLGTKQQSVLKITRHTNACIDCGLCSRTCPQGIDVADLELVRHPDCNLCGDCVSACPKEGALSLNQKLNVKWLPSVIVVLLFVSGLIVASQYNLPTVSKTWGTQQEIENSKTFTMNHMSFLKCFSSSMGFVRQMKKVDGVIGVSTYISDHRAEITYNPNKISELSIRKMLYTRSKQFIKEPKAEQELVVYKLRIKKYLTTNDLAILAKALEDEDIYQLETQFDTEIRMLVFCDSRLSESRIENLINSVKYRRENPYLVENVIKSSIPLNGLGLMKRTFRTYKASFNNFKSYPREKLRSVMLEVQDFPKNENKFKELANHVAKHYKGVVGIQAEYKQQPTVRFFYIQDMVDPQEIIEWSSKPDMTLVYTNGDTEQVPNPYKFKITN